jgi:hypothetical protein
MKSQGSRPQVFFVNRTMILSAYIGDRFLELEQLPKNPKGAHPAINVQNLTGDPVRGIG